MSDDRLDLQAFALQGFSPQQAQDWADIGVTDAIEAVRWSLAKLTPTAAASWLASGFTASEARLWRQFGHDLAAATERRSAGEAPGDDVRHGPVSDFDASRRVLEPLALAAVERRRGSAPLDADVEAFHAAVFDHLTSGPALARYNRSSLTYIAVPWVDEEATLWAAAGFDALEALDWKQLGIPVAIASSLAEQGIRATEVAISWLGLGVPLAEIGTWLGAGVSAADAAAQRAKGVTVEHAAVLQALRGSVEA